MAEGEAGSELSKYLEWKKAIAIARGNEIEVEGNGHVVVMMKCTEREYLRISLAACIVTHHSIEISHIRNIQ